MCKHPVKKKYKFMKNNSFLKINSRKIQCQSKQSRFKTRFTCFESYTFKISVKPNKSPTCTSLNESFNGLIKIQNEMYNIKCVQSLSNIMLYYVVIEQLVTTSFSYI